MSALASAIDLQDEAVLAQRREMLALVDELRAIERRIEAHSAERRAQFDRRQQLLPRERLAWLIDRGSPFLELSTIAGLGMHDDDGGERAMGGCVVTGIGFVSGVRCVVVVHDSGIKGGIIQPIGVRKVLRAQQVAQENKLPCVYLVESGGGNLHHQFEAFTLGGGMFRNLSRMSAMGLPQVAVVHGSSTAGGAYLPGLCDYVVMVRKRAKVFLAGPPLLKAATGEIATDEELGGADMHGSVSGVCDYLVDSDPEGIACARRILASLPRQPGSPPPPVPPAPPRYRPEELAGVVPVDFRRGYDMREVVARIVDDSVFAEFKAGIGMATVCGQSRMEGHPVAIIGNNGPIDADGAAKAAQFIQLMCQARTPIVYLQNITGFMVGTEVERRGIVKHGAKMLQAISNATVPQLTLLIGASFGAGNYGMCGRGFEPRFIFAWPNSRTATMGGEQAAQVMTIVAQERAAREGRALETAQVAANERKLVEQFERESRALYASARLFDDGIIDPRDTRRVLAFCLATCREADTARLSPNTFGVARL